MAISWWEFWTKRAVRLGRHSGEDGDDGGSDVGVEEGTRSEWMPKRMVS